MLNKILLLIFGIGLVTANPIIPDCVENYTTFYNKYLNVSNTAILRNYIDLNANSCGKECSLLNNCTSFNYFPEEILSGKHSRCNLLTSKYKLNLLLQKTDVDFFLKSTATCPVVKVTNMLLSILLSIFIIILCIVIYYCILINKDQSYEQL